MENMETKVQEGDYCHDCVHCGEACPGDPEVVECSDYLPVDIWTEMKL